MATYSGMNKDSLTSLANPFKTVSAGLYPNTMLDVFEWAEWMWLHYGLYSQAIKKSVRYFITDVEIFNTKTSSVNYETRKKYEDFLKDSFNILDELAQIGDEYIGFGNSFTSVHIPIRRELRCSKCGLTQPLRRVDYKFEQFKFIGDCPGCKRKKVEFQRLDIPIENDEDKIKIIRWDPHHIMITYSEATDTSEYYLKIPDDWKKDIKEGKPIIMSQIPWEFVEAVKNDQLFKFNPEYFKHLKCGTAAAFNSTLKGWGLPAFMSQFEQVAYLKILQRYNEAIAMDYIVPFRVITPPASNGGDPLHQTVDLGRYLSNVRTMLMEHKKDPTSWHTLPFPVQYQALGGEGSNMAPVQLMDRALDDLLTSMGIPQEFYRGSLATANYTPIGLRLFEKVWTHYTTALDEWLKWFLNICSIELTWEKVRGKLIRTSVYEDDSIRMAKVDLAAANQISKHTAYRALGIDPDYENIRIAEEQKQAAAIQEELSKSMEEEQVLKDQLAKAPPMTMETMQAMQQEGQGGGMPQQQQGGGVRNLQENPDTIDSLMAQAEELAAQIITMQSGERQSYLRQLGKDNEALQAMVKKKLQQMEQQAAMQGKIMARQGQL